jgi:hypothetical protein
MSADFLCSIASLVGVNRFQSALHYIATTEFHYRAIIDLRYTSRVVRYSARLTSSVCAYCGLEVDLLCLDVLEYSL